jgi:hypothetical protein
MEGGKINRHTHRNRYGEDIVISKVGDTDFIMSRIPMDFMRTSVNEKNEVIMFDPSGGPYITAEHGDQPGVDMGWFEPEWKHFIIEKIEFDLIGKSAKLKCKYMKPIYWEQIK